MTKQELSKLLDEKFPEVSQEIRNRYQFDENLDTNNIYSLPVDKVIIPFIDACIEVIRKIN